MDWVNVTAQFENAVDTVESHDYLVREGYAFVHVSAQAAGICCLPTSRRRPGIPVRYGLPGTDRQVLHHPGDAYALDMFAQIAQALKSPTGIDPMGGLDVQRIIAAGQSQSAGKLDDYLHADGRTAPGEHVIDAFLIHGRVANRAVAISTAANAKSTHVLQLNSDNEAYSNNPSANPYYAQWDVAGTAHSSFWIGVHSELGQSPRFAGGPQVPATADDDLHVGNPPYTGYATWNYGEQISPGQQVCIAQGAQFPMHYAVNAAFDAIQRWLVDGEPPPCADPLTCPRFQMNGSSLARDANKNALGGIRLAPIEHPVASYRSTDCVLGGITVPFTEAQLLTLYPTHADYACQMRETTYQNVKDGWLLEEDAHSLLSRVDGAVNRWPTAPGVADCDDDAIPDAQDNCPLVPNTDQADDGGINTHTPDGIGNACQCGDVTGNGVVNGQDANAIKRHGLGAEPNPTFVKSRNCDVTGNGLCNGQDAQRRANCGARSTDPAVRPGESEQLPERRPVRAHLHELRRRGRRHHLADRGRPERAGRDALRVLLGGLGRHDRVRRGRVRVRHDARDGGQHGLAEGRRDGPRPGPAQDDPRLPRQRHARGPVVLAHGRPHDREHDDPRHAGLLAQGVRLEPRGDPQRAHDVVERRHQPGRRDRRPRRHGPDQAVHARRHVRSTSVSSPRARAPTSTRTASRATTSPTAATAATRSIPCSRTTC